MTSEPSKLTDFGFKKVPLQEKASQVKAVFDSVAPKYDLMNDLMSFGLHRLWKRIAIELSGVRAGQWVLDVASGTGDLARQYVKIVGPRGGVVMLDINAAMLSEGRDRLMDVVALDHLYCVQGNAEQLPFEDQLFDCVSIAFGLRNVTDKLAALQSMHRVLKPGGRVLVLEFSEVTVPVLKKLYDAFSFKVLPRLGKWVANDEASYRYLAESIRMHPNQKKLSELMQTAGFEKVDYHNLNGGIVAIHRGYKF